MPYKPLLTCHGLYGPPKLAYASANGISEMAHGKIEMTHGKTEMTHGKTETVHDSGDGV